MNKVSEDQPEQRIGVKERLSTSRNLLVAAALTISMLSTSVGCAISNRLKRPQLPDNKPQAGEVDKDYLKRKKEAENRLKVMREFVVQIFTEKVQRLVGTLGNQLFKLDNVSSESEEIIHYRLKTLRILKNIVRLMKREYKRVSPESSAAIGLSQLIAQSEALIKTYSGKWDINT
jgi:hypothetical protein